MDAYPERYKVLELKQRIQIGIVERKGSIPLNLLGQLNDPAIAQGAQTGQPENLQSNEF